MKAVELAIDRLLSVKKQQPSLGYEKLTIVGTCAKGVDQCAMAESRGFLELC